jgi:hypothetical protein
MPTITATTKSAKQVWASPDGQKKIFKIILSVDGADMEASTYSDAIAKEGWSGSVETYEKEGKYGTETFVKQPPKEGFGGGFSGGGKSYGAKPQGDQYTMFLSYAKDLLVAQINNGEKVDYETALQMIIGGGHTLYDSRPSAESTIKTETAPVKDDILGDLPSGKETAWNKF